MAAVVLVDVVSCNIRFLNHIIRCFMPFYKSLNVDIFCQYLFILFICVLFSRFMPCLKYIVQHAENTEYKLLRGKTIECISLIGLAVGRDKVKTLSVFVCRKGMKLVSLCVFTWSRSPFGMKMELF